MKRRGKPRFVADGVLLIDKPAGPTSHDVVEGLRRRLIPERVGHTGTLDPFATGLLVLAFNQATRLSELIGGGAKLYRGSLALGQAFDTGDPTGQVTAEAAIPELTAEAVTAALKTLEGPRMQAPPAYSAAKHQGRPLYAYARAGAPVVKPPRPITVHRAELVALTPGVVVFDMLCSRGTYVRALAEDLAQALGSVGHLRDLRRLASRPFAVEEAVGLDAALELAPDALARRLVPLAEVLDRCGLPVAALDEERAWWLRQGRVLPREVLLGQARGEHAAGAAFQVRDQDDDLVAVLRWLAPDEARPERDYETIRVFPAAGQAGRGDMQPSASASGAE
ncbi:MAG: tRNA pseudouridine(55) synthase TruB [Pseudomonadota bacterium]